MRISALIVNILGLGLLYGGIVSGQGCLKALNGESAPVSPPFNDRDGDPLPSNNAVQAIVTSYQFYCDCVNITNWETYVHPGGRLHRRWKVYDITFQLWRPSPTVNDTVCYSLVGENRFTSVDITGGGLVNLSPTPPAQPFLVANIGDVIGYRTNSRYRINEGIQLEVNNGYSKNTIWYHNYGTDGILVYNSIDSNCDLTIGTGADKSLRRRANAAPMLRISTTSAYSCPAISTSSTLSTASVYLSLPSTVADDKDVKVLQSKTRKLPYASMSLNFGSSRTPSTVSVPGKGGSSSSRSITLRLAVIVTVAVVLCALIIAVIFIILILRRKRSSKAMEDDNALDLANPNYDLASIGETVTFQTTKKKKNPELKPKQLANKNSITQDSKKEQHNIYDAVGNEDSLDYKYEGMDVIPSNSDPIHEIYSTIDSDLPVPQSSATADTPYYHIVGPHSGYASSGSSTPASETKEYDFPETQDRLYHVLEEEISDHGHEESSKTRTVFDSSGCHVPTLEERGKPSPAKEIDVQQKSKKKHYYRLKFFDEDEIYWAPATTTTDLYSQLAAKKYREVPRRQIRLDSLLGSGQFGEVYKATWSIDQHKLELAVKTLKSGASEEDSVKFLQEAAIMGQFNHRNVIKMHGVVTVGEPIYICLELLNNGDLQHYLSDLKLSGSSYEDFRDTHMMFLKFSKDIAAGMEYLSKKCFVHRDLAARNILLNESLTCKVADFGMARDLMDDTYYTSSGGKIPVKWTAPEALLYKKYSADSDVWSYGMVLFEIWSVGKKPFSTLTNSQFLQSLLEGFCQAPPPGCPRAVYALMVDCWNPVHHCRPTFKYISTEYLKQPSSRLLFWATEEHGISNGDDILGGSIEQAKELHLDLQNKYLSNS